MSNDVMNFNDIINITFSNIEKENLEKNNKLFSVWKKVVTSVSKVGQNLYDHSSVCELKNGILLIEADHPGWIQMLQMNSQYIIRGLKMYASELNICSLAFKLKGKNVNLYKADYDAQLEIEKKNNLEKIKKEEEEIQNFYKNNTNNTYFSIIVDIKKNREIILFTFRGEMKEKKRTIKEFVKIISSLTREKINNQNNNVKQ